MRREESDEDFVLRIDDVFAITGRGTAVVGPIESGVVRTGEVVEIWEGNQLIATARATVELINSRHADPRSIALVLSDVDQADIRAGQTVRRSGATAESD